MSQNVVTGKKSISRLRISCGLTAAAVFAALLITSAFVTGQDTSKDTDKNNSSGNKNLDIRSSVGDLHLGDDANAKKAGLPLYPGARLKHDEQNSGSVNLGVLTEAFGMKLVVANYESDDAPDKVVDFYREKLSRYGKVLECHTHEHGGNYHAGIDDRDFNDDDDKDDKNKNQKSKELRCEGDNSGPVIELKVGTEQNQHVVAVQPLDSHSKTTFALVYVYTRGKEGNI